MTRANLEDPLPHTHSLQGPQEDRIIKHQRIRGGIWEEASGRGDFTDYLCGRWMLGPGLEGEETGEGRAA